MLKSKVIKHRIEAFEKRLGKPHLYFAYHAAFPQSLTPDLLYRIWANFKQDSHGEPLNIHYTAVAHVLISPLCEEAGYQLYEMDSQLRVELLNRLKADKKFGPQRLTELATFLLAYIQPYLENEDPHIQQLAQVQKLIALAYCDPHQAATQIAQQLAQIDPTEKNDFLWMESLVTALDSELKQYPHLLRYAQGMGSYGRGDLQRATDFLIEIPSWGNQCLVVGIPLKIPEAVQKSRAWRKKRRRLLKLGLFALLGCGGITGAYWFYSHSQKIKVKQFKASVVTVDERGKVINTKDYPIKFFSEDLGNNLELDMVYIPGGTFLMGTDDAEIERLVKKFNQDYFRRESPQHRVTVPQFFISRYPITQAQWRAISSQEDLKVDIDLRPDPSSFKGDNRPVERVSWFDAVEFCKRLSKLTEREYRLPSEAEWEYACRVGTTTPFHFGATLTDQLANYRATETYALEKAGQYRRETTPVGQFPPNAFGLYDMHGNVWEWCLDHWHENYNGAPDDGSAWLEEDNVGGQQNENDNRFRLLRGGSYSSLPRYCRSADRFNPDPRVSNVNVSFRVVLAARTLYPFFL